MECGELFFWMGVAYIAGYILTDAMMDLRESVRAYRKRKADTDVRE